MRCAYAGHNEYAHSQARMRCACASHNNNNNDDNNNTDFKCLFLGKFKDIGKKFTMKIIN